MPPRIRTGTHLARLDEEGPNIFIGDDTILGSGSPVEELPASPSHRLNFADAMPSPSRRRQMLARSDSGRSLSDQVDEPQEQPQELQAASEEATTNHVSPSNPEEKKPSSGNKRRPPGGGLLLFYNDDTDTAIEEDIVADSTATESEPVVDLGQRVPSFERPKDGPSVKSASSSKEDTYSDDFVSSSMGGVSDKPQQSASGGEDNKKTTNRNAQATSITPAVPAARTTSGGTFVASQFGGSTSAPSTTTTGQLPTTTTGGPLLAANDGGLLAGLTHTGLGTSSSRTSGAAATSTAASFSSPSKHLTTSSSYHASAPMSAGKTPLGGPLSASREGGFRHLSSEFPFAPGVHAQKDFSPSIIPPSTSTTPAVNLKASASSAFLLESSRPKVLDAVKDRRPTGRFAASETEETEVGKRSVVEDDWRDSSPSKKPLHLEPLAASGLATSSVSGFAPQNQPCSSGMVRAAQNIAFSGNPASATATRGFKTEHMAKPSMPPETTAQAGASNKPFQAPGVERASQDTKHTTSSAIPSSSSSASSSSDSVERLEAHGIEMSKFFSSAWERLDREKQSAIAAEEFETALQKHREQMGLKFAREEFSRRHGALGGHKARLRQNLLLQIQAERYQECIRLKRNEAELNHALEQLRLSELEWKKKVNQNPRLLAALERHPVKFLPPMLLPSFIHNGEEEGGLGFDLDVDNI
ncbi:unnamed protein product, partial [Amoebophrya sp. A25]|eukprot:GSA25T00021446001.1